MSRIEGLDKVELIAISNLLRVRDIVVHPDWRDIMMHALYNGGAPDAAASTASQAPRK